MNAQQEGRKSPSPSDACSLPSSRLINNSKPDWLLGDPCGLVDNHDDAEKDIWTEPLNGKHWDECRDMLKKHDEKALQEWNDDINTQLLVSSLLAAVTGGFVVEAQKSLSEDPAVTSAVILLRIARQLNESIALPDTDFMAFGGPSPVERAFNSLFYASLGLSLANVTLGLLCLQWIRGMKYEPPGLLSRKHPTFRYGRYLGFERWGAKAIVAALPLLLLAALLAFFAGLLVFASDSDWIASIPLYVVLPSVVAVVLFTTFVPGLVIIINMAFRKTSQFPSVPPFRSLQSWIAMQGFIRIFRAINIGFEFNPDGVFPLLRKCLDWGQVDELWTDWTIKFIDDSLLFPLTLSTGTIEGMNSISNIIEDLSALDVQPKFRKLNILLDLASYGEGMPATTQGNIVGRLLIELAGLINVGVSLNTLSNSFSIEENITLDFLTVESLHQIVNSLSFLCRTTDTSYKSFWNLFWRALGELLQCRSVMDDAAVGPILFNDVLDSMQIALENSSTDTHTIFQRGFKSFVKFLAYEMEKERAWEQITTASAVLRSIVLHPIWGPAREIIANLPAGEPQTTAAQKCMRTLDRIRRDFPPAPAQMEPDDPPREQLASQGEPGRPTTPPPSHIAIDVVSDGGDEGTVPDIASPHAGVDTEFDEDENDEDEADGETGPRTFPMGEPLMTTTSAPLTLPAPPVESPTSPPHTEV